MFRNQNAVQRKKTIRMAIIGTVSVLFIIAAIALLVVLIPRKHNDPLDLIECPGFKSKSECFDHGCSYDPVQNGPHCFMKKGDFGYILSEINPRENGLTLKLESKVKQTPYGPSIPLVSVDVDFITEDILRVKLFDTSTKRYEVPVQKHFSLLQKVENLDPSKLSYEVLLSNVNETFNFKVQRKNGTVLWDTSIGGLVMSDQFLQIASYLPSDYVFGLGEHTREHLRHDMNYVTWPMFSRDRLPERGQINLYGVHPFYTCLEKTSESHGVLLLNSNAMEATLLPAPGISFRTIGGVLDLFYFVGNNPEHVTQLYTSLIGRPLMPPYWGLGFQISRYGYDHLKNVTNVVDRTRQAQIPQDVQFLDIDHMDVNKDFTYNKENFSGLPEYIRKTQKEHNLKWIIIIDPAIAASKNYKPYTSGLEKNVFIKRAPKWDKNIFPPTLQDYNVTFGIVWPREPVAFPDFFLNETKEWWVETLTGYHDELPFDGLWIDMNEPSNFGTNGEDYEFCEWTNKPKNECWVLQCPTSGYDDPIYNPLEKSGSPKLSSKTLCMESRQGKDEEPYLHYDVHSLYAWSQSIATLEAAEKSTGTRSLVISRATYPSSGRYCGHWLGDNRSIWKDLHDSIIGIQEFNLFGIPYIGADVCGFSESTTPELCARWMQAGAFYTFFRNHNMKGSPEQDPVYLGDQVTDISRKAVIRRYSLLPYLYTLFYKAHVTGSTVIRPLFHEFPYDKTTWDIDEQFLWGSCLLISPILREGEKTVKAYLPKGEWWDFNFENSTLEKESEKFITKYVEDYIPLHARGGCIVPTEDTKLTTPSKDEIRYISLYVFPKEVKASGEIFIDDGISKDTVTKKSYLFLQFQLNNCDLEIQKVDDSNYDGTQPLLKQVIVFKVADAPSTVNINGGSKSLSFNYDKEKQVLTIDVSSEIKSVQKISWKNKDNNCQILY